MNISPLFSESLLKWYDQHGRTDLPWQHPRTLYRVWVSEIMLQQTQVVTVMRYFDHFMARFPTIESLAQANLDAVLSEWSGLGYYARARNLWKSAKIICENAQGEMPTTLEAWVALPGVGRSTAGAILAQSLNHVVPILDGNVKRVLSRYMAFNECVDDKSAEAKLWEISTSLLPASRLADYTQALMDLGATLCKKSSPTCEVCPLKKACVAFAQKTVLDYPIRKVKKAIPSKTADVAVILNEKNHVFLMRREEKGIWGGLWSLPEFDLMTWQSKTEISKLAKVKHAFTHFKLTLQPYLVMAEKEKTALEGKWFTFTAALKLGLPAPIRRILVTVQAMALT